MTVRECTDCGSTELDIGDVDPGSWFHRTDDRATVCSGCLAIRTADKRFADGDW